MASGPSDPSDPARPLPAETLGLLAPALSRIPEGVALVEAPSGRTLFRNDQASLIFGRDPALGFKADGSPYAATEWPLARSLASGEVVEGEEVEIERADGSRGFIRMSSAPVRAGDGRIVAGLVTFHDITDSKRDERKRTFLSRAGVLLGESLEPGDILRRLARLAVPALADWCMVFTRNGEHVEAVAAEHRDADQRQRAEIMIRRQAVAGGPPSAAARVLAGGRAEL
ncbi:MAG TPA: PAS domain-containing protein, partial [Vicinamibacteria bacterium]|nr:PAS domain-containing protein [Vicinamibacteria bacterium]